MSDEKIFMATKLVGWKTRFLPTSFDSSTTSLGRFRRYL